MKINPHKITDAIRDIKNAIPIVFAINMIAHWSETRRSNVLTVWITIVAAAMIEQIIVAHSMEYSIINLINSFLSKFSNIFKFPFAF